MAACDYVYLSGLRARSGAPVVDLDGVKYRVVRNGKGRSRLDRWADDPLPDGCVGEIRLSDLALALEKSGSLSVEVTVKTEDGFYTATLHPSSAMGRDGRGDQGIKASLESLPLEFRRVAAIDQIRTLCPEHVGLRGCNSCTTHLYIST
jgi:hypothetical protein